VSALLVTLMRLGRVDFSQMGLSSESL